MNANGLPNYLRLMGLKNVSGRRKVLPGAQYLEDLENYEQDVSGTANPKINIPETDVGQELTPKSYDVRANEVIGQNERDYLARFGQAMKPHMGVQQEAQPPPIETQQVQASEGLPTTDAAQELQQEEDNEGIFSKIGRSLKGYFKPFGSYEHWTGESFPERREAAENTQLRVQNIIPEEYRAAQDLAKQNQQQLLGEKLAKAQENPMQVAVYGASDIVANQPDLKEKFNEISGIDFSDEIARQTSEYERVLDDIENNYNAQEEGYSEQEKMIRQRILDNQATDADKFYIGLAVLMPLIAGAFFGKEAALGAVEGSAKGLSNVFEGRKKNTAENEKILRDLMDRKSELGLEKSKLDLKRLEIPSEIRKNLPKDELEHLIGKNSVSWTDPQTGEQRAGVQIKPGLVALPEFISDKEELKEMRKEAQELSSAITPVKEINKLTSDIIDIASKMKDKTFMGQAFSSILAGKSPTLATKNGEQIEFDGRKVNAGVALENKIKLLVDAYRQAKGMRALTGSVQDHIEGLFSNPYTSFLSYKDSIDQMLYIRDLAQSRLLENVKSSGFVPEFVAKELQPNVKSTYGKLNKKEGEKQASELLRE